MVDEIYDRTYQNGREQLHAGLDRMFEKLGTGLATTFRAIHDIEFAAPWKKSAPKDAGCA